jgi:cytochrome d ubiquinol oxidase subunit II
MHVPIDYATLRIIWWILLGVLLIGFAIMDGFDLGIGMLLPIVARNNSERRIVINSIGAVWEGNQIWLILGAGAIFAAWPTIYAITFSGFYFAMLLMLFALILRPVGFKYRGKIDNTHWRTLWDSCLFIAGLVPALIFGVAIGNVLQGVPFHFDNFLQAFYSGTLLDLLNPFALLCGLVSISMLIMHGGIYLAIKTEGAIQTRASRYSRIAALFYILLFALGGFAIAYYIKGYSIISTVAHNEPSNPLFKQVSMQVGDWLSNYATNPILLIVPVIGFLGAIMTILMSAVNYYKTAWVMSALCIAATIGTVGVSMFPFVLPSITNPNMSLLVWDASSSQLTLFIMLVAAIIFLPIIILYTSWIYYVLRGKVTADDIDKNQDNLY